MVSPGCLDRKIPKVVSPGRLDPKGAEEGACPLPGVDVAEIGQHGQRVAGPQQEHALQEGHVLGLVEHADRLQQLPAIPRTPPWATPAKSQTSKFLQLLEKRHGNGLETTATGQCLSAPVPLCTSPIVHQSHCVPNLSCTSPIVYLSHCVPIISCTSPIVHQSHCVPVPLCTRLHCSHTLMVTDTGIKTAEG